VLLNRSVLNIVITIVSVTVVVGGIVDFQDIAVLDNPLVVEIYSYLFSTAVETQSVVLAVLNCSVLNDAKMIEFAVVLACFVGFQDIAIFGC